MGENGRVNLTNKHLRELPHDHFHHLGFGSESTNLKEKFGDVKFVITSGSTGRISSFAELLRDRLQVEGKLENLIKTDRFVMYKIGPVLAANHGMGVPSASILLNEILKLLHYADASDVAIFRLGTSGGLGMNPGDVVITKTAFDAMLRPFHETAICGELVQHSTEMHAELADDLLSCSSQVGYTTVQGNTMACDDFYEGQGRLDGAFCDYDEAAKLAFLKKAHTLGVKNIEMEGTILASMCNRANVKCASICVVLVNRLKGDQVNITPEEYKEYGQRPIHIVLAYIKKQMGQ